MIKSHIKETAAPVLSNDHTPPSSEIALHAAEVSDEVWSALLRFKAGRHVEPDPTWRPRELAAWKLYAPLAQADAARPFVFAQIGQSLDGRIATQDGDAQDVSGKDGLKHLHRCRALSDAVIIGVNTALADNPRLTVRLVSGDNPARVVLDAHARLPDDAGFFTQGGRRVVIQAKHTRRPPGAECVVLRFGDRGFDPSDIVDALAERGFRHLLVEGGGDTIGRFLDAAVLDRLHVAFSPLLIGSGPTGLRSSPLACLDHARRPQTTVYGLGSDIVFDCHLRQDMGKASMSTWPMRHDVEDRSDNRALSQVAASS